MIQRILIKHYKPIILKKIINQKHGQRLVSHYYNNFCSDKKHDSTQSSNDVKTAQQQIKVTKQQLTMMYKFMTDQEVATPSSDTKSDNQEGVDQYFKNPQQKISLNLIQLLSPEQFLPYFKQYSVNKKLRSEQYIKVKLIILYQYYKIGGQISQKGHKLEQYGYEYLNELMQTENMQKLDEEQLQKLLSIYCMIKQKNKQIQNLLPENPPILRKQSNNSTSLFRILVVVYEKNMNGIIKILQKYCPNSKQHTKISCWELLQVYLTLNKLLLPRQAVNLQMDKQQHKKYVLILQQNLMKISQFIKNQFNNLVQDNKLMQDDFDEGQEDQSVIKYSVVSFLHLFIKNMIHLQSRTQFSDHIFNKILSSNTKMSLQNLVPLFYTTTITLQQVQNTSANSHKKHSLTKLQTISDHYNTLILKSLQQKSINLQYNHYMMLWKTILAIYKSKRSNNKTYQLINKLVPFLQNETIRQRFQSAPEYHEHFIQKQSQIFDMLVAYRIVLGSETQFKSYSNIMHEIQNNRPTLIRMLTEIRKIYQRYHLSGQMSHSFAHNMIVAAIIANTYSNSQSKDYVIDTFDPIQIYITPTIFQAINQHKVLFPNYEKIANNLLSKIKKNSH